MNMLHRYKIMIAPHKNIGMQRFVAWNTIHRNVTTISRNLSCVLALILRKYVLDDALCMLDYANICTVLYISTGSQIQSQSAETSQDETGRRPEDTRQG